MTKVPKSSVTSSPATGLETRGSDLVKSAPAHDGAVVTVISIFLNPGRFLEEAIRSVLGQTYENWEYLLVDDGSTDGSDAVVKRYAEDDRRIAYLSHPGNRNLGMSTSRNLGIQAASGKYVAFLDADDVWMPEKLQEQLTTFSAQPEAEMVCGPTWFWRSWEGNAQSGQDSLRDLGVEGNRLYKPPELFKLLLQNRARTPAPSSVLLRRRVFDAVGGFEDAFRGMYEDQAFLSKVYLKLPVFVSEAALDKYRQHDKSHCAVAEHTGLYNPLEPNPAQFTFLRWLETHLRQNGVTDPGIWQCLRRRCWPYRHPVQYFCYKMLNKLRARSRTLLQPR